MNGTGNNTPPVLDERITAALERKPEPQIPLDFAARVAAQAVARPLPRRRAIFRFGPRFGSAIALLSMPAAALALFALAPHAAPNLHSLGFDTELALLGELALIGWWISHSFFSSSSRLSR